jgi:outer membrane PBP1 activator LpoA protein
VSACQSTPLETIEPNVPEGFPSSPEALLRQADLADGREAARLFLSATESFIQANRLDEAAQSFQRIDQALLSGARAADYRFAAAEIALHDGEPDRAAALLDAGQPGERSARQRGLWAATLPGRICHAAGDDQCAIRELTGLEVPGDQRQELHDVIWRYLGFAAGFSAPAQADRTSGREQGWWALKATVLQGISVEDQRQRVNDWRSAWPDHPAASVLPTALRAFDRDAAKARRVGLLLPLSGPLAVAGRAVRDGYIAAYLHESAQSEQEIIFYDTAAAPLPSLYEQALLDDVDVLVGPLTKEEVSTLSGLAPSVPTLVLNYLEDGQRAPSNVYQLGLAIEDEADTMVSRLLEDGAERLLVVHNNQDWSRRAAGRMTSSWPYPVTLEFFPDVKTITESVGRAMQVDASLERRDELASLLGTDLEFLPRARADLDAVVALVDTVEANALVPALRFHFAQDLPVYASSQTVRGATAQELGELAGFRVSELPWILFSDPIYQAMADVFLLQGNRFAALYALGVDAYRVSGRLTLLAPGGAHQLLGSTGLLTLDGSGRFRRELAWGLIRRGRLEPLPVMAGQSAL